MLKQRKSKQFAILISCVGNVLKNLISFIIYIYLIVVMVVDLIVLVLNCSYVNLALLIVRMIIPYGI